MIRRILTTWAASTASLLLVSNVIKGFHLTDVKAAVIAAAVIAVVNGTLGSILKFVTFPFRIMTLGVLTLVINAALLLVSAALVDGFTIDTFLAAFFGSILLSIATWVASWLLRMVIPEKSESAAKAGPGRS
ncbi:MAG: phage holin family protein [Bryobacteraceae bacterium]